MSDFKKVHKALSKAFRNSEILSASEDFKLIIFSDHHRGRRDGADDFVVCEDTYRTALNHYIDESYELCLLGDVEEFWENPFWIVMNKYKDILALEKEFHVKTKIHRIWGNHDDVWQFPDILAKFLGNLFPNISVKESLVLEFCHYGVSKPIFWYTDIKVILKVIVSLLSASFLCGLSGAIFSVYLKFRSQHQLQIIN